MAALVAAPLAHPVASTAAFPTIASFARETHAADDVLEEVPREWNVDQQDQEELEQKRNPSRQNRQFLDKRPLLHLPAARQRGSTHCPADTGTLSLTPPRALS